VIIQAAQQSSKQELALPTDAYVEVQEVHDVSFCWIEWKIIH
jgi:hypothetical protein